MKAKRNDRKIMEIKEVDLNSLKPWTKNPRKNDEASDFLASLIDTHGFINPIIASPDGTIRAGHTRFKAAKKLGLKTVPVIYIPFKNEEVAQAYSLADNKSAEWAKWDDMELAKI